MPGAGRLVRPNGAEGRPNRPAPRGSAGSSPGSAGSGGVGGRSPSSIAGLASCPGRGRASWLGGRPPPDVGRPAPSPTVPPSAGTPRGPRPELPRSPRPASVAGGYCGARRSRVGGRWRIPPAPVGSPGQTAGARTPPTRVLAGPGRPAVGARQRPAARGSCLPSRCSRPSSDSQPVSPLEPPRPQDRPAALGRHALTKAVRLGTLAGIGLVRSLHLGQPFAPGDRAHARGPRRRMRRPPRSVARAVTSVVILGVIPGDPLVATLGTVYVRKTSGRCVLHTCGPPCGRM